MKKCAVNAVLLSLIFAMFIPLAASCADGKSGANTGGADTEAKITTEEDTRVYPNLPESDFDGYKFTMLHWQVSGWDWVACDMDIEEDTGEVIETALYKRNISVEEKLNIDLTGEYQAHDKIVNTFKSSVLASDDTYDVYFIRGCEILNALNTKCMYDMFKLPYVDWTKPWWDQNSIKEFSMNNKLFFVVSDIQLTDKMSTAGMMFNKQVQADFNLGSFYQLVYDNAWYFDTMLALTKNVAADLNGNGQVDPEDRFGILSQNDFTYFMLHGSDGRYCAKDEDDMPAVAFGSERDFAVSDWIVDVMTDKKNFYNNHTDGGSYEKMFADNLGLFFVERLVVIQRLRNMKADFGILPIPKYDETQKTYGHSVSKHTTGLMCMPLTASDTGRTGIVLETLASESKYTLLPAYYETALKDKYTRDAESPDMLDLIIATRVFDIGEFFSIGGFSDKYLTIGQVGKHNIASTFASNEKAMNAAIKNINKVLEAIEKSGG